jgi:hypothetical protein
MPSVSKKQHNFMAAVANNPKFAKKAGVPSSVGKEFLTADKGKTFKEGGVMKPVDMKKNPGMAKLPTEVRNKMGYMKQGGAAHSDVKMDKKVVKKAVGMHEKQLHGGKKSDMSKLKSGGMSCAPKKMARGGGCEVKGKTKGTMIKMNKGGKAC